MPEAHFDPTRLLKRDQCVLDACAEAWLWYAVVEEEYETLLVKQVSCSPIAGKSNLRYQPTLKQWFIET
jgi:hypothetical protein